MAKQNGPFWDEVRGTGSPPPIAKLLGRKIKRVNPEAGTIEVEFRARAEFLSGVGTIQGGLLAAMLDGALGLSLRARLPDDQFAPTLELKVNFLRPARVGVLVAHGRVRQQGASVAFLEGELCDEEGNVVATATATAKIVRRSGPNRGA